MSYWKTSISQLNLVAVCWKTTASRESSHRHLNVNCWNATAGVSNFNFFFYRACCVIGHQTDWLTSAFLRRCHKMRAQQIETFLRLTGSIYPTPKHVQYHCCMTESKQHFLSLIIFDDYPFMDSHLPDAKSKDVRDEKGGNEDFEEFSRKDATILHDSTLPHTK